MFPEFCYVLSFFSDQLSLRQNGRQKLALPNCCETFLKVILCVLLPTFKPVLQQVRLLQVACKLSFDWIRLRESHDGFWPVKRVRCTDFVSRTAVYYSLCNNLICRTCFLIRGGKTRHIAIQLVLPQCCTTSGTFFLSVLPSLKCSCWFHKLHRHI